jgi:DNA-damage-inducible protein J
MLKVINVTVRMDETIKNQSEQVFNELGLTMSAAFNVFARAVARQRRIPFELTLSETNPFFSEENQARLALSKKQIAAGEVIYKTEQDLGLDDE